MTRRIDPSLIPEAPDLSFEHTLWKEGILNIAGIDEAGRGCLAGPVTAAAVILPQLEELPDLFSAIRDSKQLSREAREREQKVIEENSLDWGVGFASNQEIDQYGIVPATRLAVSRALAELKHQPEHLLVDYIVLPDNPVPQTRLVKGDARSLSIAA
ncbi:MAG: ribonuclease HII, partial [Anaerolineales bacterium]|nr:ribonuclease HII [Anaerolineales bacterium]